MFSKTIRTVICLLVITAAMESVYAQTADKQWKKSYIGITGGISALSGEFTQSDYANPNSGFASSGANVGLTGTYFITKRWGINALISYHAYGFKGAQKLANGYKDDFAVDSTTIDIKGNNYSLNFLIGPYYSLPISKRLSLDLRVLGGITNAHLAGNTVYLEDQESATFQQDQAAASAFAIQAGLALQYTISKHFGAMLNGDYFSASPDFKIDNSNRANEAGRKISSYNQSIHGLNFNLTIAYFIRN